MNWDVIIQTGITAIGTGGLSFFGAFFRFSQRLKECEETTASLLQEVTRVAKASDALRADYDRDLQHRKEMETLRAAERASRPDPIEDLRRDLVQLKQDIEKLKEKGARYVRGDVFAAFTKAQEDQWKEMARTLGRLEGMLK